MNNIRQYRGLRLDGKGWEYGYYVYDVCYPDSHATHRVNGWEVDPETVGQSTGLLDKNGKEIFEGDVVNYAVKKRFCKTKYCEENHELSAQSFCPKCGAKVEPSDFVTTSEIRFLNGSFVFYRESDKNHYQAWPTYIAEVYIAWKEIIGNIHESQSK